MRQRRDCKELDVYSLQEDALVVYEKGVVVPLHYIGEPIGLPRRVLPEYNPRQCENKCFKED